MRSRRDQSHRPNRCAFRLRAVANRRWKATRRRTLPPRRDHLDGSSDWIPSSPPRPGFRIPDGHPGNGPGSNANRHARPLGSSVLVKVKVMIEADAVAPPSATQRMVPVLENVLIARDTYRLRLRDPIMARAILPGQFVMIRPGSEGAEDPLLGRPFALYDVVRDRSDSPIAIDVVYLVVGRGTAALAQRRAGERLSIWGPLGNGFGSPPDGPVVFVAGGIGQTPFLALGRWWLGKLAYGIAPEPNDPAVSAPGSASLVPSPCPSATLLYGARTAALLAGLEDFRGAGMDVEIATDDGSAGHHGYVTELLTHRLRRGVRPALIVGCGPSPMLAAVARIAESHHVPCVVSLENHMACGFGACFSCVAPIRNHTAIIDLRRVCVEGPIFAAESVDWTGLSH